MDKLFMDKLFMDKLFMDKLFMEDFSSILFIFQARMNLNFRKNSRFLSKIFRENPWIK